MSKKLHLIGLTPDQEKTVLEVSEMLDIILTEDGLPVHFYPGENLEYRFDGKRGILVYSHKHQLLRGLGVFVENLGRGTPFCIKEKPLYDNLGVMIDCSRNAVLNMSAFKRLVRYLALMGYSNIQLYTEDTYEIKERPYYGYQRGRYAKEEFQEMDRYAGLFSIELVPCIQTLAHLGHVVKWEAFSDIRDCNDILLIDDEKTYALLDDMFRTMSKNLTSRKINIGMDEAHMVGLGRYLDKHGYQDRMELMLRHFNRVMAIARKYGYRPMMWSDMFFRLVSGGEYTADDCPIREDLLSKIPDDITLVYWNYYSTDKDIYDKMLLNHKKISPNITFAGGAWKWTGFCPNSRFSEYVAKISHKSCVEQNIRDVLITAWGDDGAECPLFAVLPAFQIWAELCYADRSDEEYLEKRYSTCAGASYSDFMNLGTASLPPDNPAPGRCGINPSKYILYQDVLGGLFDAHIQPESYRKYYTACTNVMVECTNRNPQWLYLFECQRALCNVLALKCDMGIRIRNAYHSKDKSLLQSISQNELPDLLDRLDELLVGLEKQWKLENKIFGFDVLELRLGGLKQRLLSASKRLAAYADDELDTLEELEAEALYFDGKAHKDGDSAIWSPTWHNLVSASTVVTIS
ncbi:MAG TPA: beta-N-acetylhexosaminidase [Ruminiclostridium sp.]|nr:beta-N-acetylhexosaminidase [Ruminiclostridium sp.]